MRAITAFLLAGSMWGGVRAADVVRPPLGLDLYRPAPADNYPTPARVTLGRHLFFDRRLSRDSSRSCADCHRPARAFTDGQPLGVGIGGQRTDRNVPTLVNRAWGATFFWDGRAASLEQQVLQPVFATNEMGQTADGLLKLVRAQYRWRFREAFATEAPTLDHVARALASFVRSIMAGEAAYDRYDAGAPRALSEAAVRGLGVFSGRAGCAACHVPPTFSDEQFHNTGVAWRHGSPSDEGRARATGASRDRGAFKTPTLRQVAQTAPYMHDGSMSSLEAVVEFYDAGGHSNPGLDQRLRPLRLSTREKQDLVAFLRSLTGRVVHGR